ncbi:hypothetical protein PENTCL1PPCAC_24134, partial [Pristionchus entomophagus]
NRLYSTSTFVSHFATLRRGRGLQYPWRHRVSGFLGGRGSGGGGGYGRNLGRVLARLSVGQHLAREVGVDPQHRSRIVVRVVGRGEDGERVRPEHLVPVVHTLVRPHDQIHAQMLAEGGDGARAEHTAGAAMAGRVPLRLRRRVRPEQVHHQAHVRHVGRSHDAVELLEGDQRVGDAAVCAEDALSSSYLFI